jgi:hypothetical protein
MRTSKKASSFYPWCINYLYFLPSPKPDHGNGFMHMWDEVKPALNSHLVSRKTMGYWWCFQKKMFFFKNGYDEGLSPLSPWVGWSELPSLGGPPKGVGSAWLGVIMKDCLDSYKDQFVILHYLCSYQVQPLEILWIVTWSELAWSAPQGYWWLGSTGRTRRGNVFVLVWASDGLVLFGITVKVKSCKVGKRFGIRSHWPWDRRAVLVGKVYTSAQSQNLFE